MYKVQCRLKYCQIRRYSIEKSGVLFYFQCRIYEFYSWEIVYWGNCKW